MECASLKGHSVGRHLNNAKLDLHRTALTSFTCPPPVRSLNAYGRNSNFQEGLCMASKQGVVNFILEQIGAAGAVSARKMFGEYACSVGTSCSGWCATISFSSSHPRMAARSLERM